jgi:hypothetical protein
MRPTQRHQGRGARRKHITKSQHHNITKTDKPGAQIKHHNNTNAEPATAKNIWHVAPPPTPPVTPKPQRHREITQTQNYTNHQTSNL